MSDERLVCISFYPVDFFFTYSNQDVNAFFFIILVNMHPFSLLETGVATSDMGDEIRTSCEKEESLTVEY